MSISKRGLAVFDFDGTICRRDSFLEFIRYTRGSWVFYRCMLYHLPWLLLYALRLYSNHRLKERFFSFCYKGRSTEKLAAKGREFAKEVLPRWCYPAALERIRWHQARGHDVYLLTASSGIWLTGWCEDVEVQLIGTEFETREGVYTGRIKGRNCHGPEKRRRLMPLLEQYSAEQTYGYGDSRADRYFLDLVEFSFRGALTQSSGG